MECDVYKSIKKDNYYVYVPAGEGLEQVPSALLAKLAGTELVMSITLTPERKLAKEDAVLVLANLERQGYHLQLPPADDRFNV